MSKNECASGKWLNEELGPLAVDTAEPQNAWLNKKVGTRNGY